MAQIKSFKQVIVEEVDKLLIFEVLDETLDTDTKNKVVESYRKMKDREFKGQLEIDFNTVPYYNCSLFTTKLNYLWYDSTIV